MRRLQILAQDRQLPNGPVPPARATIGYPAHQQFPLTEAHLWCGEFEPIGGADQVAEIGNLMREARAVAMIEDVRQQEREACIEDIEHDCGHEAWCNKASVIRAIRGAGRAISRKSTPPRQGESRLAC